MKATTIKPLAGALITLALTSASFAQIPNAYWTGNGNKWAGSPNNFFSTTPGGTTYLSLSTGHQYNHVYDRSSSGLMAGANYSVSMNRAGIVQSFTLVGNGTDGFTFDTPIDNQRIVTLNGNVTVSGGTHVFNNTGAALNPNMKLGTSPTIDVAAGSILSWNIPLISDSATERSVTKTGDGILAMTGAHLYTGTTAVNGGAFGVFGGNASLAGNLSFATGADLLFSDTYTLTVAGTVNFGGLSIADVAGLNSSTLAGTYTLINGNVDFTNIGNVGAGNAADIGGGKSAYFEQGSLKLIVVPEPSTLALAGLGIAGLLLFRRRMQN